MQHIHEDFIIKHNVNVSTLPEEIQISISSYNAAKIDFDKIEDQSEANRLKEKLQKLSTDIKNEIKSHIDNELSVDIPIKEQKEAILKSLFDNNTTLVSKAQLREAGYDCSNISPRGEKLNKFLLTKSRAETKYRIVQR